MTRIFHAARPVSLSYAPLDALQAVILTQSLEIEFERFDVR